MNPAYEPNPRVISNRPMLATLVDEFHLHPHSYRQFQKRRQSRSRHTQGRNAHFMLGMKTYQTRVTDTTLRRLRAAAQQSYGAVVTAILPG
jgi:hypothetical protein